MSLRGSGRAEEQRRALTCSTMFVQFLIELIRRKGGAVEDLPTWLGVPTSRLMNPDERIPLSVLLGLWDEAARRLGDDHIGLTAATAPPAGVLSVIHLAVYRGANLGDAWRRVVRFQHLAIDSAGIRLEEEGGSAFLRFRPPTGWMIPRHPTEFSITSCLIAGRRVTGAPLIPRAVRFTHARPRDVAAHAELFGIPVSSVSFEQPVSEIELAPEVLQLPVRSSDPLMTAMMERYAEEWLSRLNIDINFIDQVRRHIYTELESGVPSIAAIAKRLHMSERSFSRRLQQEGASYPKLIDTVRKELAAVYLGKRDMKLAEVAFLLGFSELSAFYRAYRRWTGMTPAQARGAATS